MNDPQTWSMIAVFSAVMLGALQLIMRGIRAEMNGIRAEMTGLRAEMNGQGSQMDGLRAQMDGLHAQMDGLRGEMNAGFAAAAADRDAIRVVMTSEIGRLDAKVDDRFDRLESVTGVRFDSVEHRLGALEGDMSLVKQRLINTSPAA